MKPPKLPKPPKERAGRPGWWTRTTNGAWRKLADTKAEAEKVLWRDYWFALGQELGELPGGTRSATKKAQAIGPWVDEFYATAMANHGLTEIPKKGHLAHTKLHLDRFLKHARIRTTADLTRSALNAFLTDLMAGKVTGKRVSAATRDHHLAKARQFAGFLVEEGALDRDPFSKARRLVTRRTREKRSTFQRRPFLVEEFDRLIDDGVMGAVTNYTDTHPNAKPETVENIRRICIERGFAYLFDAWTGGRHEALKAIRWRDIEASHVVFRAAHAKADETKRVPLVLWLREELKVWRRTQAEWLGRPARESDLLFPNLPVKLAERIREDAARAGIFADKTAEPPETIDMHSLKHTTAALCAHYGVHPKVAQILCQHADVRITLDIYTRLSPDFESAELAKLPVPRVAGFLGRRNSG